MRASRVTICDQLEDRSSPETGETRYHRVVTPGVSINDNILNYRENNFLAAVHFGKGACGWRSWISPPVSSWPPRLADHIDKLLNNFAPKGCCLRRGRRGMFKAISATSSLRSSWTTGCLRNHRPRKTAETLWSEKPEGIRRGASQKQYHRFGGYLAVPHYDAAYADGTYHLAGTYRGR